jgi:hypothetical protein
MNSTWMWPLTNHLRQSTWFAGAKLTPFVEGSCVQKSYDYRVIDHVERPSEN